MVVPCSGPTCSARWPRTPATPCSNAATCPTFPSVARQLRDEFDGSFEVFHERLAESPGFDFGRFGRPLEVYGYACAYSPDPDRPGEALLPFEARDRTAGRRRVGAVARPRPGAHGPGPRRCAAQHAARSTSTPAARTSGSSTWARRRSPEQLDAARGRPHARAVRGSARRHRLPVPCARSGSSSSAWDNHRDDQPPPTPISPSPGPAALAAQVRSGKKSAPANWSSSTCARIEALNPQLNAFRVVLAEAALEEAEQRAGPRRSAGRRADRGQGRHCLRRRGGHPRLADAMERRPRPTRRRSPVCARPGRSRSGSPRPRADDLPLDGH